jgi:NADH-quinone oxidoreductase E subunit
MAPEFSAESERQIAELLPKYPNKMAACLPTLWIAQEQFGWISDDVMRLVAQRLELPLTHIYGVVSFYTMYNREPRGRYHVQVCTNVGCMLRDAYDVLRQFEQALGIGCGETSDDGLFTLDEVECLAACGTGPCVQINDDYHEPVRPEEVNALVAKLRAAAEQKGWQPGLAAGQPVTGASPSDAGGKDAG